MSTDVLSSSLGYDIFWVDNDRPEGVTMRKWNSNLYKHRDAFLQDHMCTWSWVTAFNFIFPVASSKTAEVTGFMEISMILCHSNACAVWIDGVVNRCFCGGTKMWWEHTWCFLWAHGKLVGCKTSKWLTNALNMRYTERSQLASVAKSLNYFPSKTISGILEECNWEGLLKLVLLCSHMKCLINLFTQQLRDWHLTLYACVSNSVWDWVSVCELGCPCVYVSCT